MPRRLPWPTAVTVAIGAFLAVVTIAWVALWPARSSVAAPPGRGSGPEATVNAFAPDLLHGDNGLPASPDLPLRHGPLGTPVDTEGNAIDAHEGQDIEYFAGSYYLYGVRYGCGTHIDLSDDAPFCGFSAYRSDDLMHWRPAGVLDSPRLRAICASYCAYPKVIFSPRLGRYLLYFSSDNGGNLGSAVPSSRWLAESSSPTGPWSNLHEPKLGGGGSDGYSLAIGRDGRAYLVDFAVKSPTRTDIWVDPLNADYTATAGSATMVTSGAFDGVGVFERGPYWYLTLSQDARFFGPAKLVYLRSSSPLGPWSAPGGSATPVTVSDDSCGGTAQSVSVLPSATGPVPVELIDLYRSSPGDAGAGLPARLRHGDWNQALAGRYWAPVAFDPGGQIQPLTCTADTHIPLALPSRAQPPPVYQPDCRITRGSVIEQQWTVPRTESIRVPVFQRAYVTDPALPARTQPPTAVGSPLMIDLVTPHGVDHWTVRAGDVSWAPREVTLTLPRAVPAGSRVALRLWTAASDGCYGVLIGSAAGSPDAGRYSALVGGVRRPAPGVRLLVNRDRAPGAAGTQPPPGESRPR